MDKKLTYMEENKHLDSVKYMYLNRAKDLLDEAVICIHKGTAGKEMESDSQPVIDGINDRKKGIDFLKIIFVAKKIDKLLPK